MHLPNSKVVLGLRNIVVQETDVQHPSYLSEGLFGINSPFPEKCNLCVLNSIQNAVPCQQLQAQGTWKSIRGHLVSLDPWVFLHYPLCRAAFQAVGTLLLCSKWACPWFVSVYCPLKMSLIFWDYSWIWDQLEVTAALSIVTCSLAFHSWWVTM